MNADNSNVILADYSDFELMQELIDRKNLNFGEIVLVAQNHKLFQVRLDKVTFRTKDGGNKWENTRI